MGDMYYLFGSQSLVSVRRVNEVTAKDKRELNDILDKLGKSESYMMQSTDNGRKGNIPVTLSAILISYEDGSLTKVPGKFLKPISKNFDPAKPAAA